MKTLVETQNAPKAIGAYSQACKFGNLVFLSGQIGMNPATGELVSDKVKEQLEQVILNLKAVAEAAGSSLENTLKLNVYLLDMQDFAVVNELVSEYFGPEFPARAAVAVAQLPKNAKVEIDAISYVDSSC